MTDSIIIATVGVVGVLIALFVGVAGVLIALFVGSKKTPHVVKMSDPPRHIPKPSVDLNMVKDELDLIDKEKERNERTIEAPPITDDSVNAVLNELKEKQ